MKLNQFVICIIAIIGLNACESVNQTMENINQTLGNVNATLSQATGVPTTSSSSSIKQGYPLDSQTKNTIYQALSQAHPENSAKNLFNQAKPSIAGYIAMIACDTPSKQLAAYSAPKTVEPNGLGKPHNDIFHHKSGCLHVLRVNQIRKVTENTLEFYVYYQSPQSKESVNKKYHAIQQPNGEWLFNFWGI